MLFRRYSADLSPVLRYIVHQLYSGQTTEIVVLRELIWKMAGIEPLPDLSDSQIAAMAGGPTLRVEAGSLRYTRFTTGPWRCSSKGSTKAGESITGLPSLGLPLLIQVAQQRQACVFQLLTPHLKSLARLYDAVSSEWLLHNHLAESHFSRLRPMACYCNILELLTTPVVVSPQDYSQKVYTAGLRAG